MRLADLVSISHPFRLFGLIVVVLGAGRCADDSAEPSRARDAEPVDLGFVDSGDFEPDAAPLDVGFSFDAEAGVPDADPVDIGFPPDTGVLALCPEPGNFEAGTPECVRAADCADDIPAQSNCEFCRPFNRALCTQGRCAEPPLLEIPEGVMVRFNALGIGAQIESFAGIVVDAETSGGATVDCADVYAPTFDVNEPCYNYLDTRYTVNLGQPAQSFPFRFARFVGGRQVLLLVYAFDRLNARGAPIGVSCTAVDVPPAGTRTADLEVVGDTMRPL